MKKFSVNEQCIGCNACEEVAEKNFKVEDDMAFLTVQPENEKQEQACFEALEACPTDAIEVVEEQIADEVITAEYKVRDTLEKYPQLKEKLIELSPKFKTMQNPVMWNTIARFATFKDAAKVSGYSLCEMLHFINKELGVEDRLSKEFPDCIKEEDSLVAQSVAITWEEPETIHNISKNENNKLPQIMKKIEALDYQQCLVVESSFVIDPLIKIISDKEFLFNLVEIHPQKYRLSVYNNLKSNQNDSDTTNIIIFDNENWQLKKDSFEPLDVRQMQSDPFDIIIQKAHSLEEGSGFVLIQTFLPHPMVNMLSEMGFEHKTEEKSASEHWVYFYKTITQDSVNADNNKNKPEVVIQSATPVAYPIIMRLLQSNKIKNAVKIKELKVWEETEKHLGWIINQKADISFSAVITASKLKDSDVKMPAVFVWDNFTILTRDYIANSLEDIQGKEIYTPLFADAPPAKITKYLIQAKGLNISNFNFVYGKPFGRPEQILSDFLQGNADTVILREPEAAFAVKELKNQGIEYSEISYSKLWNEINKGFGMFPNAGVVFKGQFIREHSEIVEVFLEELKQAIEWVNENKKAAAKLSFDMMRQHPENVEEFLNRVTFQYISGDELVTKIEKFYKILIDADIVQTDLDDKLLDVFKV